MLSENDGKVQATVILTVSPSGHIKIELPLRGPIPDDRKKGEQQPKGKEHFVFKD